MIGGKIPYDDAFSNAIIKGVPVVKYSKRELATRLEELWYNCTRLVRNGGDAAR